MSSRIPVNQFGSSIYNYSENETVMYHEIQTREYVFHPDQSIPTYIKLVNSKPNKSIILLNSQIKKSSTDSFKEIWTIADEAFSSLPFKSQSDVMIIKYDDGGNLYFTYFKKYHSVKISYVYQDNSFHKKVNLGVIPYTDLDPTIPLKATLLRALRAVSSKVVLTPEVRNLLF